MTVILPDVPEIGFEPGVFAELQNEFGGLAGFWVKRENGAWSTDAVDDALLQLYLQREQLDGVTDTDERGRIALAAFGGGGLSTGKVARLAERLRELSS